jgi:hypothetical protein
LSFSACCASRTSELLAAEPPDVRVLDAVVCRVASLARADVALLLRAVSLAAYVLPYVLLGLALLAVEPPVPIVERVVSAGDVAMLPEEVPTVLLLPVLVDGRDALVPVVLLPVALDE